MKFLYTKEKVQDLLSQLGSVGENGEKGEQGESAFEIAVSEGFTGTQEEWLGSLKGEKGDKGDDGLQGEQGEKGDSTTVLNVNGGGDISFWVGTQAEYDAITTKDTNTLYVVQQ